MLGAVFSLAANFNSYRYIVGVLNSIILAEQCIE